ncbi:MAG: dolichyl-phosphate beta-glucosyltransferase [Candidatus Nanohaloarchaea archaeon]
MIPAYNEEDRIASTLDDYLEHFPDRTRFLIEMDGCTDDTPEIAGEYCRKHDNVECIEAPERLGKGGGIKFALEHVNTRYTCFTDADGSLPPEELEKLVSRLEDRDIVAGSRYLEDSEFNGDMRPARRIASYTYARLVSLFLGVDVHDTQCGAKAFKTSLLKDALSQMQSDGFGFDAELLYHAEKLNGEVPEVPVKWRHVPDDSKVKIWKVAPPMLMDLMKTWLKT